MGFWFSEYAVMIMLFNLCNYPNYMQEIQNEKEKRERKAGLPSSKRSFNVTSLTHHLVILGPTRFQLPTYISAPSAQHDCDNEEDRSKMGHIQKSKASLSQDAPAECKETHPHFS